MRLNFRQWAVLGLLILCACITVLVALFGPLRFALIGLTVTVVVSAALMLLFLRKVLSAVYRNNEDFDARLRNSAPGGAAGDAESLREELDELSESVELLHQHLPERVAVRLAYEIELGRRGATETERS
ncbi:hypothetical protein ACXR2T_09195 [Leucobacter sp. HY1910]